MYIIYYSVQDDEIKDIFYRSKSFIKRFMICSYIIIVITFYYLAIQSESEVKIIHHRSHLFETKRKHP